MPTVIPTFDDAADTITVAPTPGETPRPVSEGVQQLYRAIQKSTGAVGGYGHNGPVYGEVTMGTFQKVVEFLRENLGFGPESVFLDIGSGLGKPNMHVAMDPGVKMSFGVELEQLRWQLSMHNLRHVVKEVPGFPSECVYFGCHDATDIGHFEPFTHVYMFDVGFPPAALVSIANAFNVSRTVQALVSFTKPNRVIGMYGFAVELIGKVATRMCGSTEGHTAYIYRSLHNASPGATIPEGSRRRTTRRQQTQLDKNFFFPVKKSVVNTKTVSGNTKTVSGKGESRADGRTKTPQKADVSVCDPIVQAGIDKIIDSEAYSKWVATTGHLGIPGEGRVKRNAKRVVFFSPS